MTAPHPAWHTWLLAVPAASVFYDALANAALNHWLREPPAGNEPPLEPITFFRPLKRGVPRLREKLEALVRASGAGDQILLGVDADSEEETISEVVRLAFLDREIVVVRCQPDAAVNPKISKLVQMEGKARHRAWLLSDSEVIFSAEFLEAFRREWQAEECAALTAAYRFANLRSWPQRCDALAVLVGLWPGLALIRRFGRVRFTLGACTLLRGEALAGVGGWQAFGNDLAEDHQLGASLVRAGWTVRLSRQIATLDCDAMSWRDYWRHQRRVAVTYRVANTAGFAGMIVTHGPMWSVLCWLAFPAEPRFLSVFAMTFLLRGLSVGRMARVLDFRVPNLWRCLGIAGLVETVCWALSWLTSNVWWSGRRWRVDFRGRLSVSARR